MDALTIAIFLPAERRDEMKKTFSLLLLVGVFVGVTFCAGCGSKEPPTPTGPPAGAMQKMKESTDQKKPG